jgi:hypothetical protein
VDSLVWAVESILKTLRSQETKQSCEFWIVD